jgi:hypothetical protein
MKSAHCITEAPNNDETRRTLQPKALRTRG